MQRQDVSSSQIKSIGYEEDTETLEVEFNTGAIYQYAGVPAETHTDLMAASSHGRFLNQQIKGVYDYTKM